MMDLREYSYSKVGDIWTEADHTFLVGQLVQIDRLAQAVQDLRDKKAARGTGAEMPMISRIVSAKRAHPRPKVPIPHGTYSGYNYHGCRCELCLAKIMGGRKLR